MTWSPGSALNEKTIDLTLRRSVQAVGATRDLYPVHHDLEFARASGAEGIFFNTMFLQAFVGRCVCEWFGNDAFLRRLEIAMRGSNYVGRTLSAKGEVTAIRDMDGCTLIDAGVTLSTEDGHTTDVKLTVQLASLANPTLGSERER
jgi:acyl dehydratase